MEGPAVYLPVLGFVAAQLIINCIVCLLVIVVVGLRIVCRRMGPGIGWDDWFVIFATPLGVAMLACQGLFSVVGNGYNMDLRPELIYNEEYILEITFCMQIVYVVLLSAVKASMLCFYLRIFVTPYVQMVSKIGLAVVALWAIAYLCACIFLCNPIEAQWTGVGKCGTYMAMIQSLIATNAIGDALVMVIPMHSIWSLQMRKTDKVGITSCFLVGLACIVCAVFRLVYISSVALSTNVTGTMSTTVFLFILEPNLAILCVSIPMLRPLYTRYRKRIGGSRLQENSDYGNNRSNGYNKSMPVSAAGQLSNARADNIKIGNLSQWEMDEMEFEAGEGHHHDVKVSRGADIEHSKESAAIEVQTTWTVTRH